MSQESISIIIAVVGFFFTCLGNAIILGMFLGGFKGDMANIKERLAKIEGMFTLVPRRARNDVGEILSLGVDSMDWLVPDLGILADYRPQNKIYVQRLRLGA